MLDVDLQALRINKKMDRFVARSRDPSGLDALVIPCDQLNLICANMPLQLPLVCSTESKWKVFWWFWSHWTALGRFRHTQTHGIIFSGLSRSSVPRASDPSCFLVTGFNGMVVLTDRGPSESVVPTLLRTHKIIRFFRISSLAPGRPDLLDVEWGTFTPERT